MKQLSLKKMVSALLSGILVLLGFSACSSADDGPGNFPLMYGTYTPPFEIKGKVVEKEDVEKTISGMRVISYPVFEGKPIKEYADTLFTSTKGEFIVPARGFQYFDVLLTDIDGEENGGTFKKDSVRVDLTRMEQVDVEYNEEEGKYQYNITFELEKETDTPSEE